MAELTAAFLCAEAGIDQPVLENQVAYIQGWLEKFKTEPKAFVTAATRAQKAADFILRRTKAEATGEAAYAASGVIWGITGGVPPSILSGLAKRSPASAACPSLPAARFGPVRP